MHGSSEILNCTGWGKSYIYMLIAAQPAQKMGWLCIFGKIKVKQEMFKDKTDNFTGNFCKKEKQYVFMLLSGIIN